ncbi:MAG TPA: hypothetical protein VMN39_04055 [Longimicrobiaceae bacterium]|nr:hypothetical protein [Longimicrobiaceae bacterium]
MRGADRYRLRWPSAPVELIAAAILLGSGGAAGAQEPVPGTPRTGDPDGGVPSSAQARIDPASAADAYLDPRAADLVRLARERLTLVDRSIRGYRVRAAEKTTVRARALRRERLLWGREVVTRVDWERDGPIEIEVLAAREVVPPFLPVPQVPNGLERYVPHLAFDPSDPHIIRDWFDDAEEVFNPLKAGSEANYRYRSGGTRAIRLPDGREIRLVELQLIPRRKTVRLIEGSFWLDEATHSIVQATFRPAAPTEMLDAGPLGSVQGTLDYVTIEYGLWDLKWWLPRIVSLRGVVTASTVGSGSILYERVYSDYTIDGVPETALLPASADSTDRPRRCRTRIVIGVGGGNRSEADDDTSPARQRREADAAAPDSGSAAGSARPHPCARYHVVLPPDSVDLAASELLSPKPFDPGGTLLTRQELATIRQRVDEFSVFLRPAPRWSFAGPLGEPGLLRYNRVEGLSAGGRAHVDYGPLDASATIRVGSADRDPSGRLEGGVEWDPVRVRLAAYRELLPMDPGERPFSLGASLSSLLFGNDDGDYLRALGAELRGEPSRRLSAWYEWRLYAQQERPAMKRTDFSVPHLFDPAAVFPANEPADEATQIGGGLRLRRDIGNDPLGFRLAGEVGLDAATGTFRYARPSVTVRSGFPLPGAFVAILEGAAGASFGEMGVQHLWRLGGPTSLRGYESGELRGEAFWRGRAEVGTRFPGARLVLFSDVGWAGPVDAFEPSPLLHSAGAGVSLLDGFFRLDLARALKAPTGWRLTAYLDGWL